MKCIFIFALLGVALAAPNNNKASEPRDHEVIIDGKTYIFGDTLYNWDTALSHCRDIGKRLLTLDTRAKADFWYDWLKSHEEYNFWTWTSGHCQQYSYEFYWATTGKIFEDSETRWAAGEPNDQFFMERCVSFSGFQDGWREQQCAGDIMSYICE